MLKPRAGEKRSEFVSRCVPMVLADGGAKTQAAAVEMCEGIYTAARKKSEELLEFNYKGCSGGGKKKPKKETNAGRDLFDRPVVGTEGSVQAVSAGRYEELPSADDLNNPLPENLRSSWSKERSLRQP